MLGGNVKNNLIKQGNYRFNDLVTLLSHAPRKSEEDFSLQSLSKIKFTFYKVILFRKTKKSQESYIAPSCNYRAPCMLRNFFFSSHIYVYISTCCRMQVE